MVFQGGEKINSCVFFLSKLAIKIPEQRFGAESLWTKIPQRQQRDHVWRE